MKVKDLIELLEDCDPDAEILVDQRYVEIEIQDSTSYVNLST